MIGLSRWHQVSLGEICEFKYGRSLASNIRIPGPVPVYGSNGQVGLHNEELTNGPTVIIGRKGSFGEVNFSPTSCWPIDTTYYVDRSATDVNLRWLFHRVSALGLTKLNRAAAVPGLNRDDAYRMKLLLPPPTEQRRIAEVLDRADALRAKRRQAITLLDDLIAATFTSMFSPSRDNRQPWPDIKLGDALERGPQNGLYRPSSDYGRGTPIVRIDAFYDGVITKIDSLKRVDISAGDRDLYSLRENDILVNRVNSIDYLGKSALVPALSEPTVFESNMMRITVDDQVIDPSYLISALQMSAVKNQIRMCAKDSVNQSSINQRDVRGLQVPHPPLALQRTFANHKQEINAQKQSHIAHLAHLDTLFASLQSRAFRGELWQDDLDHLEGEGLS